MPRPEPRRSETKKSNAWAFLIGLLVVGLAAWGFSEAIEDDPEADPEVEIEEVQAAPPESITGEMAAEASRPALLGVAAIVSAPERHVDSTFAARRVEVTSVPTDRGFWTRQGAERLFVVVTGGAEGEPVAVEAGQTLLLDRATVRRPSDVDGGGLDASTLTVAQAQEVVLVVEQGALRVAEGERSTSVRRGSGGADDDTAGDSGPAAGGDSLGVVLRSD